MLRRCLRPTNRPFRERALILMFQVLSRFPEAQGWIKFNSQQWHKWMFLCCDPVLGLSVASLHDFWDRALGDAAL